MKHLLGIEDLDNETLEALLAKAEAYANDPASDKALLDGRIVCTAFFEPSTRTRLSFEAAALRLGAQVIGFADRAATSSSKGETLEDTARVLSAYADAVVLRHPDAGAAQRAAGTASVPVINAGDGSGQHPTQALVDLFTLRQALGPLEGKTVAMVGDLRYGRTVHSLVPLLQRRGAHVVQVPAPGLPLPEGDDVPVMDLEEAAASCDVLYLTRIQKERFLDEQAYREAAGRLVVDRDLLDRTGSKALVLHPLPRVGELAPDVDEHPSAKYFDQARNGVPVRMAVLAMLFEDS